MPIPAIKSSSTGTGPPVIPAINLKDEIDEKQARRSLLNGHIIRRRFSSDLMRLLSRAAVIAIVASHIVYGQPTVDLLVIQTAIDTALRAGVMDATRTLPPAAFALVVADQRGWRARDREINRRQRPANGLCSILRRAMCAHLQRLSMSFMDQNWRSTLPVGYSSGGDVGALVQDWSIPRPSPATCHRSSRYCCG